MAIELRRNVNFLIRTRLFLHKTSIVKNLNVNTKNQHVKFFFLILNNKIKTLIK